MLSSKKDVQHKITQLTVQIAQAEQDVARLETLNKIFVLQMSEAVIPFFKNDKISTCSNTVNMYSHVQLQNSQHKLKVLEEMIKSSSGFYPMGELEEMDTATLSESKITEEHKQNNESAILSSISSF